MPELKPTQLTHMECADQLHEMLARARESGGPTKSLNVMVGEASKSLHVYPIQNLAVEVCVGCFHQTAREQLDLKVAPELAKEFGCIAYCNALPKLSDRESVRDFIACVVHGMAVGIIPGSDGTRLLYGAQVAQSALPPVRRWRNRTQTAPKLASPIASTPMPSVE
jgi:hypothetical protein